MSTVFIVAPFRLFCGDNEPPPLPGQSGAAMNGQLAKLAMAYFNNEVMEILTGEPSTSYGAFAKTLSNDVPDTHV
jgi:hypothetical protein